MNFTTAALFILGLALLIAGTELLVRGASRLAAAVGVSPLVIGMTNLLHRLKPNCAPLDFAGAPPSTLPSHAPLPTHTASIRRR